MTTSLNVLVPSTTGCYGSAGILHTVSALPSRVFAGVLNFVSQERAGPILQLSLIQVYGPFSHRYFNPTTSDFMYSLLTCATLCWLGSKTL